MAEDERRRRCAGVGELALALRRRANRGKHEVIVKFTAVRVGACLAEVYD